LNLHPTQIKNSKNTLYSGNENSELKIMYYGKVDPKEIIVFWIQKSGNKNQNSIPDKKIQNRK